jgi:ATP-binding cassette subfamily B protein RaxB
MTLRLRFWQRRRVVPMLQTEVAECGLACLAMVAGYWGQHWDLAALRRRHAPSLRGCTLRQLMALATALGMEARPLRAPLAQLRQLRRPAILHWDLNHFVVLCAANGRELLLADPARGGWRLGWEEASRHYTGVALELTPGVSFTTAEVTPALPLRAFFSAVPGLRDGLLRLLFLSLALQVCVLLAPFYLQWVIDEALVSGDRPLLPVLGIGALLLACLQAGTGALRSWLGTTLSASLGFQWQGSTCAHLLRLPLAWFERRRLGDVVSRFAAVQALQKGVTTQSVEALIDGALVVLTLALMLAYSVRLAGVSLLAALGYASLRLALLRRLRGAGGAQIVHAARAQTHLLETLRAVQTVRLHGCATTRRLGWLTHLAAQCNAELDQARLTLSAGTLGQWLAAVERVVVVWLAALSILDRRLTVGMLFAYLGYRDQFNARCTALIDRWSEWRLLRLQSDRLADILLQPADAGADDAPESDAAAAAILGDIELRDVGYRHGPDDPQVLQGVTLRVHAGECVAITGPSGSGKTTLVKLLLGLHAPSEGELLVGGQPLQRYGVQRFRQCVGSVMQDDHLFSGSIADNISCFAPEPDVARIVRSAQCADVHADILALPMGYETLLGDDGAGLSGGQRQRLLLARALYRRPALLVLDEATSHLDAECERRVNAAIRALPLTRILIAHRAETLASAQRIVVLERGRVVSDRVAGSWGGPPAVAAPDLRQTQ